MAITRGTVIATIPAGIATSVSSGLLNVASTSTDNTVQWEDPIPTSVTLLNRSPSTPLNTVSMCATDPVGHVTYVLCSGGPAVSAIDTSDPTDMRAIGVPLDITNAYIDNHIVCVGSLVFVGDFNDSTVQSIDFTDPANPIIVQTLFNANFAGMQFMHSYGGRVYLGSDNTLSIITTDGAGNMTLSGQLIDSTNLSRPNMMAFSGNYGFFVRAPADNTLQTYVAVIDISNPAAPFVAGTYQNTNTASIVLKYMCDVVGSRLYVGRPSSCWIFDITTPTAITRTATQGGTWGAEPRVMIAASGGLAFYSDTGTTNLRSFTLASPDFLSAADTETGMAGSWPIQRGGPVDSTTDVAGTWLFTADWGNLSEFCAFRSYNLTNLNALGVGQVLYDVRGARPGSLLVDDDYIYTLSSMEDAGFSVHDRSDPRLPLIGNVGGNETVDGRAMARLTENLICGVSGGVGSAVGDYGALVVYDITDRADPQIAFSSFFDSSHDGNLVSRDALIVLGDTLFFAGGGWLSAWDVSDPTTPVHISTLFDTVFGVTPTDGSSYAAMAGVDSTVYVAGSAKVTAVDVSDPAAMSILFTHDEPLIERPRSMVRVDSTIFLLCDIPSAPHRVVSIGITTFPLTTRGQFNGLNDDYYSMCAGDGPHLWIGPSSGSLLACLNVINPASMSFRFTQTSVGFNGLGITRHGDSLFFGSSGKIVEWQVNH